MIDESSSRMLAENLPKFERPPVVETVLGVQFELFPNFCSAHLGAFWQALGADWSDVNDAPALEPQFEEFDKATAWQIAGLKLKLSREFNNRLQIRNRTNDGMIQVQNGRLHYNWLGHGGEAYPAFDQVRPEFERVLGMFQQFLAERAIGVLKPNQWEVTYVNHIPRGTVWQEPQDWIGLFPSLTPLPARIPAVRLESFGGEWHYEIEPRQGRLHVNVSHGWRKKPVEQEMIVLTLTARGPLGRKDLDAGLHLGHETIVRAFRDLTSEKAHKYWGLIHDET
jgi:uncharacterized protein (TIGR04255 family)